MKRNIIKEHIDYLIKCTEELQLSKNLFENYKQHYNEVYHYCTNNHLTTFGLQDAENFCKFKCLKGKSSSARGTVKIAYTVADYFKTGEFHWKAVTFTKYPISENNNELLISFESHLLKSLSEGTVRVEITIIRQFLFFLESINVLNISLISTEHVLNFVRQEAPNHKSSLAQLLRALRKFICYLRNEHIVDLDADRFLKTAGRCRQKALPCFTEEELKAIFAQVNRTTSQGCRDYAIFLLALRTGLRASDISLLKLEDIDWNNKTIQLTQKKTKVSLQLPLSVDVGNAIVDYIINFRYKTANPYLFLRIRKTPSLEPLSPTTFNSCLRRYIKKAGLERIGWDGKSFHGLRRTAGTRMVTAGVPITTVSQILGHTNTESAKRYIALDTRKLSECCLNLGILHTRKEGLK